LPLAGPVRSIARMPSWLAGLRTRWYLVALVPALVVGLALVVLATRSSSDVAVVAAPEATALPPLASPTPVPTPTPIRFAGILDGVPMTEAEWDARKDLRPVAVMVDNHPNAFPHSGLDKADLVYEAFVEGGLTRFMAVYWRQEAEQIEPVRSARTPFVIWADELGALYGHAGGATTDNDANAIGQLQEWQIADLNAFEPVASSAYYRDNDRYAPHNLVAITHMLREAGQRLGYGPAPEPASWPFKRDGEGTVAAPPARGLQLDFAGDGTPFEIVQWRWDPASHAYLRFQSGGPHIDGQTKQQLRFTNVVVMRVPWQVVDETGHVLLDQFGQGPAEVYLDGKVIVGTWNKVDRKGRTRFFDAAGNEIAFNRGPIFIEVVGPDSKVVRVAEAADLPLLPPYTPPGAAATDIIDDEPTPAPAASPTSTPSPVATPKPTGTASPAASATGTRTSSPPAGSPPASPATTASPKP